MTDCVRSTPSILSLAAPVAAIGTRLFSAYARSYAPTSRTTASFSATSKTGPFQRALRYHKLFNTAVFDRFYAEFGERIDHQRFSFRSLTDLVRVIPNVVVFYDTGVRFCFGDTPLIKRLLQVAPTMWCAQARPRNCRIFAAVCFRLRWNSAAEAFRKTYLREGSKKWA